ncbi:MAG: hypothetical protein AAFQ94_14320 [Bacteroidota bacterium]
MSVSIDSLDLFQDGHLNDTAILLYVDGLKLGKTDLLPEELLNHVSECEECRLKIFEYYEFVNEDDVTTPHPYFSKNEDTVQPKSISIKPFLIAASVALLLATCFFVFFNDDKDPGISYSGNQFKDKDSVQLNVDPVTKDSLHIAAKDSATSQPTDIKDDETVVPDKTPKIQEKNPINRVNEIETQYIALLDNQIQKARSRGISITSPKIDAIVRESLKFEWTGSSSDTLAISIFNIETQKNPDILKIAPGNNSVTIKHNYSNGLYYWNMKLLIGNRKKQIALGRFIIEN